jgi:hypothetical protein
MLQHASLLFRAWRWSLPAAVGIVVGCTLAWCSVAPGETREFDLPIAGKEHWFQRAWWDAARGQMFLCLSVDERDPNTIQIETPQTGLVWIDLHTGKMQLTRTLRRGGEVRQVRLTPEGAAVWLECEEIGPGTVNISRVSLRMQPSPEATPVVLKTWEGLPWINNRWDTLDGNDGRLFHLSSDGRHLALIQSGGRGPTQFEHWDAIEGRLLTSTALDARYQDVALLEMSQSRLILHGAHLSSERLKDRSSSLVIYSLQERRILGTHRFAGQHFHLGLIPGQDRFFCYGHSDELFRELDLFTGQVYAESLFPDQENRTVHEDGSVTITFDDVSGTRYSGAWYCAPASGILVAYEPSTSSGCVGTVGGCSVFDLATGARLRHFRVSSEILSPNHQYLMTHNRDWSWQDWCKEHPNLDATLRVFGIDLDRRSQMLPFQLTRLSDGKTTVLKRIGSSDQPTEIIASCYPTSLFSSDSSHVAVITNGSPGRAQVTIWQLPLGCHWLLGLASGLGVFVLLSLLCHAATIRRLIRRS